MPPTTVPPTRRHPSGWLPLRLPLTRLPAGLIALAAGVAVFCGLVSYRSLGPEDAGEWEARVQLMAEEIPADLLHSRAMGALEALALNSAVLHRFAEAPGMDDRGPVQGLLQSLVRDFGVANAFLLDRQGRITAYAAPAGPSGVGRDLSFRPYFQKALAGRRNIYVGIGANNGERGIYLAAPIPASGGGQPLGVLAIRLGLDSVEQLLAREATPLLLVSPDQMVFAANRSGTLLAVISHPGSLPGNNVRSGRTLPRLEDGSLLFEGERLRPITAPLRWDATDPPWTLWALLPGSPASRIPASLALGLLAGLATLLVGYWRASGRHRCGSPDGHPGEQAWKALVPGILCRWEGDTLLEGEAGLGQLLGAETQTGIDPRDFREAIPPPDQSRVTEHLASVAPGAAYRLEYPLTTSRGERWIRETGCRGIPDPEGPDAAPWFALIQDITLERERDAALAEARATSENAARTKGIFLANISHEIRTPLNVIIGLSHLAQQGETSPRLRNYLGRIHDAGASLLTLINEILDFSKLEAGRMALESAQFDLGEVVTQIFRSFAPQAREKGITLDFRPDPAIPSPLRGDPLRLGQILGCLLGNAIKFTETGEVVVEARLLEQAEERIKLAVAVRDTGPGIEPALIPKLFTPFTQGDGSTTRKHSGTGLGLALAREIVRLMGGDIWVESSLEQGTTFHFTVVLRVAPRYGVRLDVPEELRGLHVLVVDDNAASRLLLHDLLSQMSLRVDTAASGQEAIERVSAAHADDPFRLVLMDLAMPGMSGLDAGRLLKSQLGPGAPLIVVVTAFSLDEMEAEVNAAGFEGFLTKPVSRAQLLETLIRLFAPATAARLGYEEADTLPRFDGLRLLLIEGHDASQQVLYGYLTAAGVEPLTASQGDAAVALLRQEASGGRPPPQLVLMDLNLPGTDAPSLAARLRREPGLATVPILGLGTGGAAEETARSLSHGIDAVLLKPVDAPTLYRALAAWRPADNPGDEPVLANPSLSRAGIDPGVGLRRVSGNRDLYLRLLTQFADAQRQAAQQIRQALEDDDPEGAQRLAHKVRRAAGSIGAHRLAGLAAELDQAIATLQETEGQLERFREALDTCVAGIDHWAAGPSAAEGPPPGPAPDQPLRPPPEGGDEPWLNELEALLAASDGAAVDYFSQHRSGIHGALGHRFLPLEQAIMDFDFDLALNLLAAARQTRELAP